MIRFACACGNELRADDEMAGRQVLCAACGQMQTVPAVTAEKPAGAREEIQEEPPPRRRPESAEDDEDEGEFGRPPERTSGKAARSLGLGIASFLCLLFTGIPAVILGAFALRDIGRSRGRVGGQGLAIGGIVTGTIGTLLVLPAVLVALLLPAVQKVREAAARTQSTNNLKMMSLAMHNYQAAYGRMPTAGGSEGQHPGLSWRVTLLPFIEEDVLYHQFHLDEPWDSPHNKTLLTPMPRVYAMPGVEDPPGMTRYRVFVGDHAAFAGPGRDGKFPRGRRINDFPDGLSNTAFIAEAADAVPWTKPDELEYAPGRPLPRLSDVYNGCNIALGDGSVRRLPRDYPEADLRALITRDGGEPVTPP